MNTQIPKNGKKRKILKNLITALIAVGSIYLAFNKIDFNILWKYIIDANYFYILAPIPIMILSHWFRAIRWKTILKPINPNTKFHNLFSTVMIGYAFNNILPRAGELVRPYIFSKKENISFSSTFATIILERILDILTLLILFGITFIFFSNKILSLLPPSIDIGKVTYTLVILLIGLIIVFYPPVIKFIFNKILRPISPKLSETLYGLFQKFSKGFAIVKEPALYAKLSFESILIWLFYALPLFIMFYAFDFSSKGMNFMDSVLLLVASGISFSIAPTPGSIGVFHWIVKIILVKFYGVNSEQALAFATVNHGVNYLVQVLLGGYYVVRDKAWDISFNLSLGSKIPDNIAE